MRSWFFGSWLVLSLSAGCKSDPTPSAGAQSSAFSAKALPGAAPSASAAAPPLLRPKEPLNVLFITIDSLRADMPWTGYSRQIAPHLTALAAQSAVYENAYSVSSYTAKSVAAFLSGRYPSTLYRDGFFFTKYASANRFVAEILSEKGIATIAWHGHLYFGRGKGLEQGFTEWQLVPGLSFDPQTDNHVTSKKMTELGIELLKKPSNTGKQFFAWAHYMDPHDQYNKHTEAPDFGRKGRDRYDSEVFYTDLWLNKLIEFAKTQPWWKNTALIISADHGEAFGEHNFYRHAFEIYEVLTRVPLIVHAPGIEPKRIKLRRSAIDLTPTILDLMGLDTPPDMAGKSLVPELYGAEPQDREPIVLELTEDSHNPPRRGIIKGDYKLVVEGKTRHRLYNLKDDPGEDKDLAREKPEELERMKTLLAEVYTKIPSIEPYGGTTLKEGGKARGPMGPPK